MKDPRCIFCGAGGKLTNDHVPPKNLFPKPKPHNLITVPACPKCNADLSKDEEYFRLVVIYMEGTPRHADAKEVTEAIRRSQQRIEQQGFFKSFANSMIQVPIFTPAGLYIKSRPAFQIDMDRMDAVATKIVKGLFFYEKKIPLTKSHDVIVYSNLTSRRIRDGRNQVKYY